MSERSPDALSGPLALSAVCSLPAAMPAYLRVLPAGHAALAAVALLGAASLVVVPLSLWLRRAISAGLPRADQALLAGAALSSLPLALCGGVLKSTTHHRPLGGATFGVATLCLLALCIGLSFRVLRPKTSTGDSAVKSAWQNLFTLGCGLSLVSVLALGLSRAARPNLVDFLALLAAAAVASVLKIPAKLARLKLRVAVMGWVILLACALFSLTNPQLVRSLTTQAPVCFAPLSWLGGGS